MSQWRKRQQGFACNKDTRWDRIRKRYASANPVSLKSDAVRRFIDMDFIGKQNEKILIEGDNCRKQLNPAIVMDMRHQMFQAIPRKLPLATVGNLKNLDTCIAHNLQVDKHYLNNELSKLRQQLEKERKRNCLKMKSCKIPKPNLKLDNQQLMKSLECASQHIQDFYEAPVQAIEQSLLIYEEEPEHNIDSKVNDGHDIEAEAEMELDPNKLDWNAIKSDVQATWAELQITELANFEDGIENMQSCRTPSPLTPTDEFFKPMRAAAERQMLRMRCVHFEEDGNQRKLVRQVSSCSNTSDGIDSVISDLAEEALLELQTEAEEENKKEKNDNTTENHVAPKIVLIKNQLKLNGESVKRRPDELHNPFSIKRLVAPKVTFKSKTRPETQPENVCASKEDINTPTSNPERNRIIEKLFQINEQNNEAILHKYFLKWIHFTTLEKLERENCKVRIDRAQKINAFLDKIRKEKQRIRTTHTSTDCANKTNKANEQREEALKMAKQYKNKIKVQQDIIDLQKVKLERQERVIMQLKLNKLSDEHKEARQDLKQELKTFMRSGDPKAKAKAKCLQLIGNLRDGEDDDVRLQGRSLLQPKFLQNMQERAIERSIRHEQAKQRRQQAEAEREAQKMAAVEAKRLEDEEAKRLRIEVLKEKRRQEKMAKILKERERQRAVENNRKAKEFNRRLLLRRVGMEGFKRLLQRKRENQRKCEQLRTELYKRNYFISWFNFTQFLIKQKEVKADNCYRKKLKRHAITAWRRYVREEQAKLLVAIDWHSLKLTENWFQRWWHYTHRMMLIDETKMRQAVSHHEWHLKWKVLDCWQRLPQILQLEKETEERRQRWRMKIWELLPDYKPNREDNIW